MYGFRLGSTPESIIADVDFLIVNEDSPMILGLPDKIMTGWPINESASVLILRDGSVLPLHANNGHLFLRWIHQPPDGVATNLYTKEELTKIHTRNGHPHCRRMVDFLKRARPDQCHPKLRSQLEEIVNSCAACLTYSSPPRVVQVALTHDEKKFSHEVIIDIFTLERNSTLSVVDRDTPYVAAILLATVTAESIWQAVGSVGQLIKIAILRVKNALPFLEC
jgi:hypothetical protein